MSIRKKPFIEGPLAVGLAAALTHWLLTVFLQYQSFLAHLFQPEDGISALLFFLKLPFLQLEHAVVALALGAAAALVWKWALGRWLFVALFTLSNAYLVANQIAYGIFFDYLQFSLSEGRLGSLGGLLDSALAETNILMELNPLLALLATVALIALRIRQCLARVITACLPNRNGRLAPGVLTVYCVIALLAIHSGENHNLDHHPLLRLLSSTFGSTNAIPSLSASDLPLRRPLANAPKEDTAVGAGLEALRKSIRGGGWRPNVILLVLESVGTGQLFEGGRLHPRRTPNLAQLATSSVIFDSLYTSFPGRFAPIFLY